MILPSDKPKQDYMDKVRNDVEVKSSKAYETSKKPEDTGSKTESDSKLADFGEAAGEAISKAAGRVAEAQAEAGSAIVKSMTPKGSQKKRNPMGPRTLGGA